MSNNISVGGKSLPHGHVSSTQQNSHKATYSLNYNRQGKLSELFGDVNANYYRQ